MIVGHRGAAALAPENTLSGIRKAADIGIHWVEIDTQLTADGIPVIFHDDTVDRCTNGSGKLASLTLEQLKQLDAGSWFGVEFKNEQVPTLKEALQVCLDHKLCLNLEIKVHHPDRVSALVENVVAVIRSSDFPLDKLLLSSFSLNALRACQLALPTIRRGYITEEESIDYLSEIRPLSLYSVHVKHSILTSDMADRITEKGYILNIWTLNEPNKCSAFRKMKVRDIITDNPSLFSSAELS
jgi:glycerophosphoryl diester phosphodiesterase